MIDLAAAGEVPIALEPIPDEQRVAGEPQAGVVVLGTLGDHEYGVWEHSVGASSDVEVDEVFIVVAGRATVRDLRDDSVIALEPGSVGRLEAGTPTVWTVTETLRKVWIA